MLTASVARSSGIGRAQQLRLAAFPIKQIAPFSRDAQDSRHARRHPRRSTARDALAVGDLRALPTSHADGACAVDHPVGPRQLERHAASFGPLHPMRWQRRRDPNSGLGRAADASARMAEGRHLGANLCHPIPFPPTSALGLDRVGARLGKAPARGCAGAIELIESLLLQRRNSIIAAPFQAEANVDDVSVSADVSVVEGSGGAQTRSFRRVAVRWAWVGQGADGQIGKVHPSAWFLRALEPMLHRTIPPVRWCINQTPNAALRWCANIRVLYFHFLANSRQMRMPGV